MKAFWVTLSLAALLFVLLSTIPACSIEEAEPVSAPDETAASAEGSGASPAPVDALRNRRDMLREEGLGDPAP